MLNIKSTHPNFKVIMNMNRLVDLFTEGEARVMQITTIPQLPPITTLQLVIG